ncbi:MAG TPA: hypothetical protein VEP90_05635, partial [Methylomirabilota bacterium]|nr:hypothetical protein [Methylomirabilota bacterium]
TKGLVSDDLPDVMKARESDPRFKYHYKFIDSPPDKKKEPSVSLEDTEHKDAMDAYVRSADFPNFMMTKSSDLENVKSSENIESRSSSDLNYVTVAKDVLKTAILSQPSLKEGGVLREDIGIKDLNKEIQKGIDRTKLRKFGRGVLDEEGEARFRRDFPDVAEDVIKMYRKSKRGM